MAAMLVMESLRTEQGAYVDEHFLDRTLARAAPCDEASPALESRMFVGTSGTGAAAEVVYRWGAYRRGCGLHESPLSEVEARVSACSITGCKAFTVASDPSRTRVLLNLRKASRVSLCVRGCDGASEERDGILPPKLREDLAHSREHCFVLRAPCGAVRAALSPVCMFAPTLPVRSKPSYRGGRQSLLAGGCAGRKRFRSRDLVTDSLMSPSKRKTPVEALKEYVVQEDTTLERWDDLMKRMCKVCNVKAGNVVVASRAPERRYGALRIRVTIEGSQTSGWLSLQGIVEKTR
eukprot:TRINITY_DN50591_c0_g1_i1.p1 TRINITY_DN50591_c0_g1~~TRINITY_DN50591_c0_g1_i1.p1  ORF type:complete len:301 (+),score=30.95 TRINITY_DN50591_c0_g1_i1:30-905(+)